MDVALAKEALKLYDAGGNEKSISYNGKERPHLIIIDAKVIDFEVEEDLIKVIRNPLITYKIKGGVDTYLSNKYEYWIIDTKKHKEWRVDTPFIIKNKGL